MITTAEIRAPRRFCRREIRGVKQIGGEWGRKLRRVGGDIMSIETSGQARDTERFNFPLEVRRQEESEKQ